MFSYRHGYHAGNHADVLKHLTLVAVLRHLCAKDTPLQVIDSHAGAGLYRLDSDQARTSGEASAGIQAVWAACRSEQNKPLAQAEQALAAPQSIASSAPPEDILTDYLDVLADFNPHGGLRHYPGSPAIAHHMLRPRDALKLCELHPTDGRLLQREVDGWPDARHVAVLREDGFETVRRFLPPPSRRGLLICDPSYEIKSDYGRVVSLLDDTLQRFVTGCVLIWVPILPRPDAHELPRRVRTLAQRHGRAWVHASLTVRQGRVSADGPGGLPGSAVLVINPPHTLADRLRAALPKVAAALTGSPRVSWTVDAREAPKAGA